MPAVGKTSVGSALAQIMERSFIDTDQAIESEDGRSCVSIIRDSGEPFFRKLEEVVALNILSRAGPGIISLGGGAWMHREVRALTTATAAFSIWLDLPLALLKRRIHMQERITAFNADGTDKLEAMYALRSSVYAEAQIHLQLGEGATATSSAFAILDKIAAFL
jgi:shikimate kinase